MPHKGLLLRGDASDLQQGETLLKGAIDEGESEDHDIHLKLSKTLFFFHSCLWLTETSNKVVFLMVLNFPTQAIQGCVFFVSSRCLCPWSAVENLQNLLFTRIGDQNPNEEKKTCEDEVGSADEVGEAEENHTAGARTCKFHSMAIGGAKELNYW